jgi:hypothetical protein
MLMDWLAALEQTELSQWVVAGDMGEAMMWMPVYYVILAVHAIGMAMIVGIGFVITARLWGYARSLPLAVLNKLLMFGWWGFWINAVSGVLLFIGQPRRELVTLAFDLKILAIAVACIMFVMMSNALRGAQVTANADGTVSEVIPQRARMTATISMIFWGLAIVFGRVIAYTQPNPSVFYQ